MSSFPITVTLQRSNKENSKPYYTKRVSCEGDTVTLTPDDYAAGHSLYALVPRFVVAYPVYAATSVDAHNDFPQYKRWTDGLTNDFGVKLGKNSSVAAWDNLWGSTGFHFHGVVWTGQNKAITFTGDDRAMNNVSLDLGGPTMASGGSGVAITSFRNSIGQDFGQHFFSIGLDGSVNILKILAPDEVTNKPGETTTIAPAGSAMTVGGGSICVVYSWLENFKDDIWDAWWVSPDGHLTHSQFHGTSTIAPKVWGRTKVWHSDDQVTALTGESLRDRWGGMQDSTDTIVWFVAKHGTGQKGILYQTTRVDGEVSTAEVQQDDSECYVAPGSGISSEVSNKGPIVAWITAEGAVMTLLQDFKVENDPVFKQIAPPGSAALESTVRIGGAFIWWFGPNYELMAAYSENRFQQDIEYKDITWSTWEVLPAGVGRKGKDSIATGGGNGNSVWFAGADDLAHNIYLDDSDQFDQYI
ncbi:hypothetical protein TWF506_005951 [Arthrobotrys conoides]|uniref:Uncharacterized protein n=1 Tax=Arthrobotrys conoides TaxID=74498 RepID=A0AAN8S3Y8_9PEZI